MRAGTGAKRRVRAVVDRALAHRGYELSPLSDPFADVRGMLDFVRPYTMTSDARVADTIAATRYVVENRVPGALVECGVWKGGNAMAIALQLVALGDLSRDLWLYDTFAGMTEPTSADVHLRPLDYDVRERWEREQNGSANAWAFAPLEQVQQAMWSTGYRASGMRFVVGPVEETIPAQAPEQIALLRLDTDWYESTKHELEHLFPRLVPGGVLIIDDYGTWGGCRQAVAEYVVERGVRLFLQRSDESGRIAVKQV